MKSETQHRRIAASKAQLAPHIQDGVLLAGERGAGKVFGGRARTYGVGRVATGPAPERSDVGSDVRRNVQPGQRLADARANLADRSNILDV